MLRGNLVNRIILHLGSFSGYVLYDPLVNGEGDLGVLDKWKVLLMCVCVENSVIGKSKMQHPR